MFVLNYFSVLRTIPTSDMHSFFGWTCQTVFVVYSYDVKKFILVYLELPFLQRLTFLVSDLLFLVWPCQTLSM